MTLRQLSTMADQVIASTQQKLPAAIREPATAVPIIYELAPSNDVINERLDSDLLGLFTGPSHGTELDQDQPMPPQIILYLENLWDYAGGNHADYCREVRITYLHELGHYFGWDEDELEARGLA